MSKAKPKVLNQRQIDSLNNLEDIRSKRDRNSINILGKETHGLTRMALEQSAVTPENKELLKRVQALETEIKDKNKWRDYSQAEKQEYIANKIHDIQMRHYTDCQAKRAEVAKRLQEERAKWERANIKDAATRTITWQRYQAELALMNKNEIASKMQSVDSNVDPDFLYAAAEYCSRQHPDIVAEVKSAIIDTSASEPWLRDEGIKDLADLAETYNVEYGQVKTHPSAAGMELIEDVQAIFTEDK